MELIVVANNLEHVRTLCELKINNIVVSSKYSSYRQEFSIDDITKAYELNNNIVVSFYDLISESIIDEVTSYIDKLIEIGVANFIVNDFGLVQYLKQFDVTITYDSITTSTNYETINILNSVGINKVVLGREITVKEINEIADNAKCDLIVHIQGAFPIFTSIRKLLTNYSKAKDVSFSNDNLALYQKERSAKYPIIENDNGVVMFTSYDQCGIEDISKINVKYFLIDQVFSSNEDSLDIVKMYMDYKSYKLEDIQAKCNNKQSKGFFYKKTMYKL